MKALLNDFYHIKCIGIIKINDRVFRIKTHDNDYILKITKYDIDDLYRYIHSMNITCFISIIENINHNYLTPYNGEYCYVMNYIDLNTNQYNQDKEKLFYQILLKIHQCSLKEEHVNKKMMNQLIHHLDDVIQQRFNYYSQLMQQYECYTQRSPSGWMFVLNYYKIVESLNKSKHYLDLFKSKETTIMRKCLIYPNFDYDHISLKHQCLISVEHIQFDYFIYDLYDLFQKISIHHMNVNYFKEFYFDHMKINDDEKMLISCLMYLIPQITLCSNEMDNIISLSYLLEYIDDIDSIID